MVSPRRKGCWALALLAASAGAVLPSSASAATSCAFDAGSGRLTVTQSIDTNPTTILGALSPTVPGQTLVAVPSASPGACPDRTGVEVAGITYVQAGGVSDLVILEPSALRRGAGAADPAAEIPVTIDDSLATDGTLVHIVLRDLDGLPERWVFSTNGATPAAPMGVNANASEAAPDFDITMATPAFATFDAVGSPGADVIDGSGGGGQGSPHLRSLRISGRDGADVLTGGGAGDEIDGGAGDDAIDGGPGFDIADYATSVLPVSIDLAAAGPQDGGSLGRDTLASIEYLAGGEAGDLLRGAAGNEFLDGGLGDDVLEGRGGDDGLFGDLGSDTASYATAGGPVTVDLALTTAQATGAAGTDTLEEIENLTGGPDTDVLRGTAGPNALDGGLGGDALFALEGDDTVNARDGGPDTVNCGPGTDRATVDPAGIDAVTGCETVVAGVAAGLPGGPTTSGPGSQARRTVAARLTGSTSQKLVRGAITLRLGCPVLSCAARATASTKLRVGAGPRTRRVALLPARARIPAGKSRLLRLKLAPSGLAKVRAALVAGRRPLVRVTVAVTDAAASKRTLRRTIALRP